MKWISLDSAWLILQTHFRNAEISPGGGDYFSVDQKYEWVNMQGRGCLYGRNSTYLNQSRKNRKQSGSTIAVYSHYVVDTSFQNIWRWSGAPPTTGLWTGQQLLENGTHRTAHWKIPVYSLPDSVKRAHTAAYLDSVDRYNNKVTLKKIIFWTG